MELQVLDPDDASRLASPFCPFLLRPLVGKPSPESLRLELVPELQNLRAVHTPYLQYLLLQVCAHRRLARWIRSG